MKERNGDSSARGELQATGASSERNEAPPEARGLSQTMRDPARKKRSVRRKAKSYCQPHGNGGASSSSSARPAGVTAGGATTNGKRNSQERSDKSLAASDDATGTTLARDAHSAAACTGQDACAEVAGSFSDGCPNSHACSSGQAGSGEASGTDDDRRPRAPDDAPLLCDTKETAASEMASPEESSPAEYSPGVQESLAFDAPGFVEEMHARVNLYAEYQKLLEAADLKVKQRALELLLEMKYGRGAPSSTDEPPLRVDVEFPKPQ